ncbi:hypothetical protein MMC11_005600 [Xylographa trunciseda]|nr:hypothetical protein [Xylographa trunciseda]
MPCHLYFDTQEARQSHWNTEHGGVSCLLNDDGNLCLTVGLPEEACVQFWCGFCVETIEMDDRTPYDCSRMNHFSSAHSGSTYDNRHWIAIEQKQWEDFTSNAVEILLNKGLMHNYPVNSRREVAWHFASRLLEHQRKLVPSKVPWAASSGTACATSFSDELDPATGT